MIRFAAIEPVPGHAERIHHSFEDPPAPGSANPDATMAIFRRVRDEIRGWLKEFMSEAGRA